MFYNSRMPDPFRVTVALPQFVNPVSRLSEGSPGGHHHAGGVSINISTIPSFSVGNGIRQMESIRRRAVLSTVERSFTTHRLNTLTHTHAHINNYMFEKTSHVRE